MKDEALLGWLHGDDFGGFADRIDMSDADESKIDELYQLYSDEKLQAFVQHAAKKRVGKKILTEEGMYAVRYLAALLVAKEELGNLTPAGAMATLLNAIVDRIGARRGQWLNSLAVIGKRLIGEGFYGDAADLRTLYNSRASERFCPPPGVPWTYDVADGA